MSNSFSISVDVELAALTAALAVVDGVVDNIRAVDVPAIQTNINANETKIDANLDAVNAVGVIVADIHDTDLPGVETIVTQTGLLLIDVHDTDLPAVKGAVDDNGVILVDVHDTDLPAVKTDTGNIRGTDIGTITDAITAKMIRGEFESTHLKNPGGAFTEVLNITGSGKLIMLGIATDATGGGRVKLVIDGRQYQSGIIVPGADNWYFALEPSEDAWQGMLQEQNTPVMINMEFQDSLVVEAQHTAVNIDFIVFYSLD